MTTDSAEPSSGASPTQPASSQWQRLLKNAGTWQGSFTTFSPEGKILSDVPTEVELTPTNDGKSMHQEVRRYPPGEPPKIQAFDYSSLSKATLFFENGAFSQGSIQWAPFSTFGAELGLIFGTERTRLAVIYDDTGQLKSITLIRETLKGSTGITKPHFKPDDFVGNWEGECTVWNIDSQQEQTWSNYTTSSEWTETHEIHEPTTIIDGVSVRPILGAITEPVISFRGGSEPVNQILMLPNGCYCRCPLQSNPRKTDLFIELGWMLSDRTRQRIRRYYNPPGAWEKLILWTEQRV